MNPVRSSVGNATARLASTRFAGPPLRFGPAGDPSRSAAYRLAMAVRGLTATAGWRGHRRLSSTTGFPANRVDFGTGKWGRQISTDDGYTMPCQSWRANLNRISPTHGIPDRYLHCGSIRRDSIRHDRPRSAVPLHRAFEELQRRPAISPFPDLGGKQGPNWFHQYQTVS